MFMGKISNSKDLIMVLLYAKGSSGRTCEPIKGITRLTKMIFLFKKEIRRKLNLNKVIPNEALPNFEAYDFGPFAKDIYNDLEFLKDMGLIESQSIFSREASDEELEEYKYWQTGISIGQGEFQNSQYEKFFPSTLGKKFVESEFKNTLSKEQWNIIEEFKKKCNVASLKSLLRYVYLKYPTMIKKSKIKDEILS